MSGFDPDWLALREPYDAKARDPELLARLGAWAAERPRLRVVDLGAGTGNAVRALRPWLPPRTHWTLIEQDARLIETGMAGFDPASVRYREADLAAALEDVLAGPVDLVTASALTDLVSAAWLDRLVRKVRELNAALWVGLTYDGQLAFDPALPADAMVRTEFHRDMVRDKGFGIALGHAAHEALIARLDRYGGTLLAAPSPWVLGEADLPMKRALLDGIAAAATTPRTAGTVDAWRAERQAALATTTITVGHRDLLFLPG